MKVIIAGSRSVDDYVHVVEAVELSGFTITEVVSGTARGVDLLGETYAQQKDIPVVQFPADWDILGHRAGFIRNRQMGEYAEALIAVWDGTSSGTQHMINVAKNNGLKIYVHLVRAVKTKPVAF